MPYFLLVARREPALSAAERPLLGGERCAALNHSGGTLDNS